MKHAIQTAAVVLLSIAFLAQCGKSIRGEAGPDASKKRIMIAVYSSEYKKKLARDLADRYRDRSNVTVIPMRRLGSVDYRSFDALVLIDALMAWKMFNVYSTSFIMQVKEPEERGKIVLYLTAANPKENYRLQGIDCITGASVMNNNENDVNRISEKLDAVLRKR